MTLRYQLRTLILLAILPPLLVVTGCRKYDPVSKKSKSDDVRKGLEDMGEHAGKIEAATRQDNSP